MSRIWGLAGITVFSSLLFAGSTSPTLAAWCWCKTNANTCEAHTTNDATPRQNIALQSECNAYCSGRGTGWQATNFDTTWIDRAGLAVNGQCPDTRTRGGESSAQQPVQQTLYNPLGTDVTIPDMVGRIVKAITGVIGSIALLAFVYGGVRWMTAYTDAGVEVAKNTLKNAFIGLLLIFFSYALSSLLLSLFSGT